MKVLSLVLGGFTFLLYLTRQIAAYQITSILFIPILTFASNMNATVQLNSDTPVLVGAGDIADCASPGAEATAELLDHIPGVVFAAGDEAYETGSESNFEQCYAPAWGRFKDRTYPAAGNHEYYSTDAAPYYDYFGSVAGGKGKGYYSFDLGAWHILMLNSNCSEIGGCDPGSPQAQWLQADLAAHPALCTLAIWHHPLYSSGPHGKNYFMQPIWQMLYAAGADLIINGHDHDYERFAPQDSSGKVDPRYGIREIVAGTGGASHYIFGPIIDNSEVQNDDTFGVVKLTLHPTSYDWQFIPIAGQSFTDSGSGDCHPAPPA